LNSELLQNGLVIVDTPGINTVLSEHLALTAKTVDAADRVLYVMAKPLTDSDRAFIRVILDSGVKMIFVRTHIDDLKCTEEDKKQTISQEKEVLCPFTDDELFFVSNEAECEDFSEISKLHDYLKVNLADKVEDTLAEAAAYKGKFIAGRLLKEITEKKVEIGSVLSGNRDEYMAKKAELEDALKEMDTILARNKESLRKKYEKTRSEAKAQLREERKYCEKRISGKISEIPFDMPQDKILAKVESCVKEGCLKLEQSYVDHFNHMLADNKKALEDKLTQFDFYMAIDANIPETLSESDDLSEELSNKYAVLRALEGDLSRQLEEYGTKADASDKAREDLLAEQGELQQALCSVQKELRNLPEYTPQYVVTQQGNDSHEMLFRTVGSALDIATIFIPGKGWATLGAKVLGGAAKGAKVIKAGKIAAKIEQAAKVVGEVGKAGEVADKAIDATRILNRIFHPKEQRQLERQCKSLQKGLDAAKSMKDQISERTNIFDYLSLEYWFAKVGRKFDTPEVKEINKEYENQYRQQKDELQKRVYEAANAEYQKRCELLDIKDEQEQIKLKREITERKLKAAQEDMLRLEQEMRKRKAQAKANACREFYLDAAGKKLEEFCEYLNSDFAAKIDESMVSYIDTHDFRIASSINRKRIELEELDRLYHTASKGELEQALSQCNEYEKFLVNLSSK